MPEVCRSKYDFSLDVVFMVISIGKSGGTPSHASGEGCVTPRWVDKAKASATEQAGGRSQMDAVRAGSVTQWELRRNLEDRWLPGMLLTTSAGMGAAWPGLMCGAAMNR
ncbi:hypothetical protein XAC3810_340040 [Xanthomonas citri pv. citri]|nr:hypothetical protein XAC3810_340040 [Xanthomonas citri pv. citri]CEE61616.1 hypothetical protein XAC3608_1940040 [Xanthomonas citri pv. citri]CEH38949.1 hypothetical protein XACLG97_11070009 [Xanthomonas citri pv. citri]CEH83730.1 hypothetical protein XACB302_10770009 [Xanthomonas citri pv. citri]CEI13414.1 hypothetical protein XACG115_3350019 [Xanthomonas citri pv. citri]